METDDQQSRAYQCPHNDAYWHVLTVPRQLQPERAGEGETG